MNGIKIRAYNYNEQLYADHANSHFGHNTVQMFNKCLIWPQCLKYVEKILIFDCAGQKSDEIVAHGKHWLSRHFEVMPGEGGVSNYAFPVPWPGRRDHCSIQVPPWLMLTMAWWWYLYLYDAKVSPSTIVLTGGLDTEALVTEVGDVRQTGSPPKASGLGNLTRCWHHCQFHHLLLEVRRGTCLVSSGTTGGCVQKQTNIFLLLFVYWVKVFSMSQFPKAAQTMKNSNHFMFLIENWYF